MMNGGNLRGCTGHADASMRAISANRRAVRDYKWWCALEDMYAADFLPTKKYPALTGEPTLYHKKSLRVSKH